MERLSFNKSISDEERRARWERVYVQVEEMQALRNIQSVTTKARMSFHWTLQIIE